MPSISRAALVLTASTGLLLTGPALTASAEPLPPVTPTAPIVSDAECGVGQDTFVLPATEGLEYSVTLAGERGVLPAGVEIPGVVALLPWFAELGEVDDLEEVPALPATATVTVDVAALPGYELAPGAPTSFDVALDVTPCDGPATAPVVVTSTRCEQVTVTNPAGNPDAFLVLTTDPDDPTDVFDADLPAGETTTLDVAPGTWSWAAFDATLEDDDLLDGFTEGDLTERLSEADGPDSAAGQLRTRAAEMLEADAPAITPEDLELLREVGEMLDELGQMGVLLGEGEVTVAECPAPTTPPTPVIPAVVQTDGGTATPSPAGGILATLAGLLGLGALLHRVRRSA